MEAFALYLLKSVIWLTGFAFIYFIFLRNERFFLLKRYFLIAGILVSFVFPLFTFHYQVEISAAEVNPAGIIPSGAVSTTALQPVLQHKTFDYRYVILLIYLAGIFFLAFKSIRNTRVLIKTINKTKVNYRNRAKLIITPEFSSSFSFFNYVFINPEIDGQELDVIVNHELVHVNQKHWLDLLLVELLRLVQWVNPFVWIYTRFIKLNHEYIADELMLQKTTDPAVYKAVLVNQLFDSKVISLSNSFNYSINKKRFDMMKKIVTSPYRKMKVLLVLPVFAIVFYAFAAPEYHYAAPSDNKFTYLNQDPQQKNTVKIRNSDGSQAKPLIVVDGKISTKGVEEIDPATIASMTVLKGDSATEKYGKQGKDGVIEITTKGKSATEVTGQTPENNQKTVKGIISDENGQPLNRVNIMSTGNPGNASSVATGKDGRFELKNVRSDASLLFYCQSYKGLTLKADFTKEMSVTMVKDPDFKSSVVQQNGPLVVNGGERRAGGVMEEPFVVVEEMPMYPGGEGELLKFLDVNTTYPEEARAQKIEGKVIVRFIVNTNGDTEGISVLKGVHPLLDAEAKRVVSMLSGFKPGRQGGKDVPVWYMVPINFALPVTNQP